MNVKLIYHILPWEIDYCLLTFTQLKKSKYFLAKDVNITIQTVLNLSSYLIDWEKSKLTKEFFISKYEALSNLLIDFNHIKNIYQGDALYGHLNLQRESISEDTDYYIFLCPDTSFGPKLLSYMVEAARVIQQQYFVLTPQISMFWDSTWDVITHPNFLDDSKRKEWYKTDVFDTIHFNENNTNDIFLTKANSHKWAGWFDLYSKKFFEEIGGPIDEWNGYGGWDFFTMILVNTLRDRIDFQQYILNNQIVFEYSVGPLYGENRDGFAQYYKSFLSLKENTQIQRTHFEENIPVYVKQKINDLILRKII